MSEVFPGTASDTGTAPRASANIRHLCRMEIAGGGQIVIDGNYAYVGHQHRPQGTSILDISDPRKPKILSTLTTQPPMVALAQGALPRGPHNRQLRVRGRRWCSPGRIP
jgi:hypothetical protein